MTKKRHYIKHKAFEDAYNEVKTNPSVGSDGFDAPKRYHHNPDKLLIFKNFSHYNIWANNLHTASTSLNGCLEEIYYNANRASSSYYRLNSEKNLNAILIELDNLQSDLSDLREDIRKFQACMLATHISERQTSIGLLSDTLKQFLSLEDRIIEVCNRKLFEISSSRMSFYSLFVAIIVLLFTLFQIFSTLGKGGVEV